MRLIPEQAMSALLGWFMSGDVGASSESIACAYAYAGRYPRYGDHYPLDIGDLGRCLRLIRTVPEAREGVNILAGRCVVWRELASIWDELAAQAERDGVISHRSTLGDGPNTTGEMLRAAIDRGRAKGRQA